MNKPAALEALRLNGGLDAFFKRENLPSGVKEIYFSGKFWYCASFYKWGGKSKCVGSGRTEQEAISDMRKQKSNVELTGDALLRRPC